MCPAITGELVFALQRVYTEAPRTSLFVSKMFLVLALVFFWYPFGTGTGCVGEVQEPDMAAARSFTGCVLPSTERVPQPENRYCHSFSPYLWFFDSSTIYQTILASLF